MIQQKPDDPVDRLASGMQKSGPRATHEIAWYRRAMKSGGRVDINDSGGHSPPEPDAHRVHGIPAILRNSDARRFSLVGNDSVLGADNRCGPTPLDQTDARNMTARIDSPDLRVVAS